MQNIPLSQNEKIIRTAVWTQIKTGNLSAAELFYCYLRTLWHRLMSDLFISLHEIFFDFSHIFGKYSKKTVVSLSEMLLSLARTRSPQVCRMFHEPFRRRVHKQTETPTGTSVFLILCFGPVGTGEPWQPNTEGRKICLAELHPSGSHA